MTRYSVEDVTKSYNWLGHRGRGWTELNAFHPDYKPGQEHFAWNVERQAFPKVWYARTPEEVVKFIEKFYQTRTVCFGLNPRPKNFRNDRGFPRSAYDREIEASQNAVFDLDSDAKQATDAQMSALKGFLDEKAFAYFKDLGLIPPVQAYTGRGYHVLFAYSPIVVKDHPDVADKLKEFRKRFGDEFRHELQNLEVRVDNTQDLRRMVRIYGTAKPYIGIPSVFYGSERVEDAGLKDYLLALEISEPAAAVRNTSKGIVAAGTQLPDWFGELLQHDEQTRLLWLGEGKPEHTDSSGSGFDFSLTKRLLFLGHRNIDDLATILAMRPNGSVQHSGKGEYYVRRTIANALVK